MAKSYSLSYCTHAFIHDDDKVSSAFICRSLCDPGVNYQPRLQATWEVEKDVSNTPSTGSSKFALADALAIRNFNINRT